VCVAGRQLQQRRIVRNRLPAAAAACCQRRRPAAAAAAAADCRPVQLMMMVIRRRNFVKSARTTPTLGYLSIHPSARQIIRDVDVVVRDSL